MPRRDVERREVVVVELDLGSLDDPVAHADEHVLDLTTRLREQVQVAGVERVTRERDVDALLLQAFLERPAPEPLAALRDQGLDHPPDLVSTLAEARTLLGRKTRKRAQYLCELG